MIKLRHRIEKAQEKALNVVRELRSEDWGQRHFCIEDPNGLYLDVVQAIAPSEEYQQGYDPGNPLSPLP